MNKKLLLPVFFLVACQSIGSVQTSSEKATPPPASTEIFVATQTLEMIPSPTFTPFYLGYRVIEVPRWVSHSFPGGILALPFKASAEVNPDKFMFVNPNTGETFIVDLHKEYYYYHWKDSERIVYYHEGDCDELPKFISEFNVSSGISQIYETQDYPESVLDCYLNPEDKLIRLSNEFSEQAVELIDPSNGEVFLLTNPNDGATDISVTLSPYERYIAVVQFEGAFDSPESQALVYGNKISIFDFRTHRLVLQYSEEQGILSEVSFVDYSNLAYMRGNTPCLIMILSEVKKCIHNIPNNFPNSTIILSQHSYHDGGRLRFLIFSKQQGDYCSYNLVNGDMGCLADRFSILRNQFVNNYSLSYYGHYLLIEYGSKGCPMPWCDYPKDTNLAVINFNEGKIFELGNSDFYSLSGAFRPLNPNPWQPWRW